MGRHHLIIDGYNVMYAHPEYGSLARQDIDVARAQLVNDLTMLAVQEEKVTVVFDGGGNPHSDGAPHRIGGLTVLFSPAGMTADTVIEALAQRARERDEVVMVVTSDRATRDVVRSGSVSIRSAESFIDDITRAREADSVPRPARRIALSERIDPVVSARLARWARG
ncbi:MAG: NYN domain-containing protein [Coriobacteriia bacterium]|nr:NYN domain-containing protein [Coriobacteriia bacterium]